MGTKQQPDQHLWQIHDFGLVPILEPSLYNQDRTIPICSHSGREFFCISDQNVDWFIGLFISKNTFFYGDLRTMQSFI